MVASTPHSPISSYMRVSCAYEVSQALNANRIAAITPARRPNSLQAPQPPAGIVRIPNSTDSEWVASTESPNALIHRCSSM